MSYPVIALAAALGLSLLGNVVLTKVWLGADRRATAVTEQRDQARATATACSDATEALRTLADRRQKDARAATQAAEQRARTAEERANRERSAPVTPADAPVQEACELAQRQNAEWLKGRVKP